MLYYNYYNYNLIILQLANTPSHPRFRDTGIKNKMSDSEGRLYTEVQEYYGKTLQSSSDLKTNACCTTSGRKKPRSVLEALSLVHDQVIAK